MNAGPSSRKIRVCHVQSVPLLAGAQRVMVDVLKHLDSRRFERHAVCGSPGAMTEVLEADGVQCHFVPMLQRSIHPIRDCQAFRHLRALFRAQAFDVVHTHSSKPGVLGRLAARSAGIPAIVHHVHGFSFHDQTPTPLRVLGMLAERFAGKCCDRVVFVSDEERRSSVRASILSEEKCRTIYNGVDLRQFAPSRTSRAEDSLRRELGISADETMILFACRFAPQKQPLIVPEIAKRLQAQLPGAAWRIVMAGTGPLEAALREEIERCGVAARVQISRWCDAPEKLMQAADIVLHPTLWEGLPLTLIEAQATGLPVVASDVKGNREVVADATGVLCGPHDANAYAAALCRYLQMPTLGRVAGTAGRRNAEQHFDAAVNYGRFAGLYEELLDISGVPAVLRAA